MSAHRIHWSRREAPRGRFGNARWALLSALVLLPLACDAKDYGPGPAQSDEFMLRGTVLDTDSNPVPRARVWVFRDNENLPFVTTAEADGSYSVPFERGACNATFEGARHMAWVSCPDCIAELVRCPYSVEGEVASDVEVDLHVRPEAYVVSGTVSLLYGPVLAGVDVTLWPSGDLLATSGEDGTFSVALSLDDCRGPSGLEALNRIGFFGRSLSFTCDLCEGRRTELSCDWNAEHEVELYVWPEYF